MFKNGARPKPLFSTNVLPRSERVTTSLRGGYRLIPDSPPAGQDHVLTAILARPDIYFTENSTGFLEDSIGPYASEELRWHDGLVPFPVLYVPGTLIGPLKPNDPSIGCKTWLVRCALSSLVSL